MAFNNVQPPEGPFSLSVGDSVGVSIFYGNPGQDRGAQWIMANPIGRSPGALEVSGFVKRRQFLGGRDTAVTYEATVTCIDDGGSGYGLTLFDLSGGGNV